MSSYHYLYRITNLVEQKHYYGIRTTKNILPHQDLGIKYFSSSTDKNFIKDQKNNTENYRYKIVIVSTSRTRVANLEIKLHKKFNVGINPKFYNKALHTSSGFDVSGKITVKDKFGHTSLVSVDDPRYLSGELQHMSKGYVTIKDKHGKYFNVSVDDPRYLSGELQHMQKGYVTTKDQYGNCFQVSVTDRRYLSGELQHIQKGRVNVKDQGGNRFNVSVDDPRYLSGELQHISKGYVTIKDKHGKYFSVSVDDPRYLSGELQHMSKGRLPVKDKFGHTSLVSVDDPRYLSGELQSINCGTKWIYNPESKKNAKIKPDQSLPDGWFYGFKKNM